MTDDKQTTIPASEQFDLTAGMDFQLTPDELEVLVSDLESAETFDSENASDETLAEYVAALKRLESVAEDARKEVFESELDERADVGDEIGDIAKWEGSRRYVKDDNAVIDAIEDAGGDPFDVVSVKASDAEDTLRTLGEDPEEYIGKQTYTYFRR